MLVRISLLDFDRFERVRAHMRLQLLAAQSPDGHWEGFLSTSALSTATAVVALALVDKQNFADQISIGLGWLAANMNEDGGYGDTTSSISNVSTTALVWGAFGLVEDPQFSPQVKRIESWLCAQTGGTDPEQIAATILQRYAQDRTFSVPILTMLALCGRLGKGATAWRRIVPLPFELAMVPRRWFRRLRLPVVSYALPALIAIGQAIFQHRGTRNPISALLRRLARRKTLELLAEIQPENGGFLEAVPLTSFVVMSLASMGFHTHEVVTKGVAFLLRSQREDGSWPIDTHLATWLTTLSVKALSYEAGIGQAHPEKVTKWLLDQQFSAVHPYTMADPGGWAWTPLPGGVPDADDTSGAVVALSLLQLRPEGKPRQAAQSGLRWLLGLQNRDGGMPTFCKGWGTLPFDRSCPDITAHYLHALAQWEELAADHPLFRASAQRAFQYLLRTQTAEGAWLPLWFGNQGHPQNHNPVYGTAKVLVGLAHATALFPRPVLMETVQKGLEFLLRVQDPQGGWGGAEGLVPSVEETALAVEALSVVSSNFEWAPELAQPCFLAAEAGVSWLVMHAATGIEKPSPIGFYFANLWYWERLYPLIFTVAAFDSFASHSRSKPSFSPHSSPVARAACSGQNA